MKKIAFVFLSIFLITPCMANIHIYSGTVETVVKQKFTGTDAQIAAVAEYNAQVEKANNAGMPASGIWSVCKAGGWDITKPDGESKCRDFGNTLLKYATWKFKEVCGKDDFMVKKGTGECVGDVFSNKILGGIKVNMLIAPGLAKEYARVKFADQNLVCNNKHRSTTIPPDDYVQCLSMDKNMAYEFRFDSVTTTTDYVIDEGTESGICKIYDLKYTPSGSKQATYLGNGQKVGDYESWPAACETTDAAKCSKINETMQKFGRTAKIGSTGSKGNKHSACIIKKDAISASSLRTAFGIDNYVFKKGGVQLNATTAVKDQVCAYVRQAVKSPTITSCVCNDGFTQLYDFSGMITEIDDVLTCKVNNKPIDFVFDDLSEHNKKIAAGGSQGMDCMAAGGTYAGQQCMYLDEKQCKLLAKANLKNCPNCKKVEYKNGVCQLPSGADAVQVQKNTRLALIVGGAVVGVVVTVASAGTAGAPVAAVVFTLVETTGAVMEYKAQVKIDGIVDEFLLTSMKCESASCAEKLIKEHLQRMSNIANDMQPAERNAVDLELARLIKMLPATSQALTDIVGGESLTEANHKSLLDSESWEPEQVWRAVGVALQMASIFGSVGKWVLTKAGVLSKTLPETTIQLTSKAKMSRVEIQKALSQGKVVKTSNGIEIPRTQLAADFYGYDVVPLGNANNELIGIAPNGLINDPLFNVPSQYPKVNELETWLNRIGGSLNSNLDNQAQVIYSFGIQRGYEGTAISKLRELGIPYTTQEVRGGTAFVIKEQKLAETFPAYATKENPIVTRMVNEVGEDALDRAKNVQDLDDIVAQKQVYSKALSGAIDQRQLERYAQAVYDDYIDAIAKDRELANKVIEFSNGSLDLEQKRQLAATLSARYNAHHGCNGLNCNYRPDLGKALGNHSMGTTTLDLNPTRIETAGLNKFLGTVAHENNHYLDEIGKGALNPRQVKLSEVANGVASASDDLDGVIAYRSHLTEQASYAVSDVFDAKSDKNIVQDILNRIEQLHLYGY